MRSKRNRVIEISRRLERAINELKNIMENDMNANENLEKPMETPVHEREEREAADRAYASNDKLQFDNLIHQERLVAANEKVQMDNLIHQERLVAANEKVQFDNLVTQSNLRNNNSIDHSNNTSKYAEVALANAVSFQQQMNQEYLRDVGQERAHADDRHHMAVEHNDLRYHHALENDRYTLDRLYSVFPEEAAGLQMIIEAAVRKAVTPTT